MDSGFDENQTELGVKVLAVTVHVLADGNGLLDEVVKILGKGGGKACEECVREAIPETCERKTNIPLDFKIRRILVPVTLLT